MALSDTFVRAVGRVTVNFAALELYAAFLLSGWLAADPQIGLAVTSEMNFGRTRAALASVARLKSLDAEDLEAVLGLLARAAEVETKRNMVVHCVWLRGPDDEPDTATRWKITAKERKGLAHKTEQLTASEVNMIGDEIKDVAEQFLQLTVRLSTKYGGPIPRVTP